MIKMAAFDLDGTICDSIALCIKAFCNAVEPYIDHKLTKIEIISTFGLNEIGMVKKIAKKNWENALADFYSYYELWHDMCTMPFDGIWELIVYLKQNHIIVPLITGKGEKSCKITLQKIGLYHIFDDFMYGSEKYPQKEESILFLLNKYSIQKNEFLYIGDTITDVDACNSIGVTCLSAAWKKENDFEKLKAINPSYTFEHVNELKKFLVSKI